MKRLIYTLLAFWLSFFSLKAEVVKTINADGRPTVAVVLAGGGAKGTAHIGALKVIEECGIPIDIVVGTSMGSIIGGLYSVGYTTDELLEIVRGTDWISLLLDTPDFGKQMLTSRKNQENYLLRVSMDRARMFSGTSRGGIIHGRNITTLLDHLTHGVPTNSDFNSFPMAFACVATDAITGNKHVFHEGNIVTAMRSSMAIPSIFTPVKLGDMALVDGGIVDNYPVDVARDMGADIVIGLDLVSEISDEELANSALDVLMSMLDLISKNRYEENIKNTDVYVKINTAGFNAASFSETAIDTLIVRGEDAGRKCIGELKSLAERIKAKSSAKSDNGNRRIASVTYSNNVNDVYSNRFDEKADSVPDNVRSVFQTGTIGIGARFDNQDYASLQGSLDISLLRRRHVDLSLYGRLGMKMAGGVSIAQCYRNGGKIEAGYRFEHKDLNFYYKGLRVISVVDYHQQTDIHYRQEWRKFGYSFGLRYDVDRYRSLLIHRDVFNVAENVNSENNFSYFFNAEYNSLNSQYFPTKGSQIEVKADLMTSNLYKFKGSPPVPIFQTNWRTAIALTPNFVAIPHGSFRYITSGSEAIPLSWSNFIGGLHREMWMDQQVEMAGLLNLEIVNRDAMGIVGLELQHRLGKNNFITFTADGASLSNAINEVLGEQGLFYGFNVGYHYRGIAGPVSFIGMWNSRTKEFGAVMNIGYYF